MPAQNPNLVTAKLMAEIAVDFNIGADLVSKGNRAIEKYLGAEQASGDTVYVPIMDSGKVYKNMDLTGIDLAVKRDAVPVTVNSYTAAANVSHEDFTLSINNPELMTKRVAKLANEANLDAYRTLQRGSTAFVVPATKTTEEIRMAAFDAEAFTVGSKLGGSTFGVSHPTTHNRIVTSLQANFGGNQNLGKDLYRNELGDFMGFSWSKGSDQNTITAVDSDWGDITLTDGSDVFTFDGTGPTTTVVGAVSQPFNVAGVYAADALGIATGRLATFYAVYDGSDWKLTYPADFTGARQANWTATINDAGAVVPTTVVGAGIDQLNTGTTYLSPSVIWKENDFLVGVKGLEKFHGSDSFTVPTAFRERGILPLRGTAWTDPLKGVSLFRVDLLLGFALYQRVSVSSIWIPA